MRKWIVSTIAAAAMLGLADTAAGELQNVLVDGSIRIRGNYYTNIAHHGGVRELRWPAGFLPFRPFGAIGRPVPGAPFAPAGIASNFSWSNQSTNQHFVEMRTRLGVQADFTNDVSAYIELDSYDIWGEDFRSNYITGLDGHSGSLDDVEVYQAYVQAGQMWGYPLQLRIGRQELSFGSEWLVGVNDASSTFSGLSFDAVRATYATDLFSVDAWGSQLFNGSPFEADGDVDFYGVYGSYLGLEDITLDAYWMWVRDGRKLKDTNGFWLLEWFEDLFGVDDYDVTNLHTIGLRGAGAIDAFDFDLEAAYQFGNADQVGYLFPVTPRVYGDNRADFDNFGFNAELGYTFDMPWQPRVYLGAAYFEGEDNRDLNPWQWLLARAWPFYRGTASVSFNRLFSNWEYSEFIENTELSNAWIYRGGIGATPTESVELLLSLAYFQTDVPFKAPRHFRIGGFRVPIAPAHSWWTQTNSDSLGWELGLYATYHYSEDLTFEAGWAHLFVRDGLRDGNFSALNGLEFNGGRGRKDADYLYIETRLSF